jgi:hypothetical protein
MNDIRTICLIAWIGFFIWWVDNFLDTFVLWKTLTNLQKFWHIVINILIIIPLALMSYVLITL